jgi:arsenite-transporting ATPase
MQVLTDATPIMFFTGKGGVGKTSISCAVAVALADRGRSVLLVSTDPASNVDEVFDTPLGSSPTGIAAVPGLEAMNVDPEAAAAAYRERVVGPYRGVLPEAAIAAMEEQLAGACTVEIAAFDEFAKLIGTPQILQGFDHVVFDTAPTGHTLRLLSLPTAWTGFIENNTAGTSCMGPLQGLVDQREIYAAAVAALSDAQRTTLVLVSRPEHAALDEAARTSAELEDIGVRNQSLVINGVFQATDPSDPLARDMQALGAEALAKMPPRLAAFTRDTIALKSGQLIGVDALRGLLSDADLPLVAAAATTGVLPPSMDELIDELAESRSGIVMTMGKGGVGKTTLAASIAVTLARRGIPVHLSTTDPAAHVVGAVHDVPPGLEIGQIDPQTEVARYRDEVMRTTGANLDANGRALLEEDLSSPCTEEIAPRRSPCSRPSRARCTMPATGSWSSTPHPPATRSCCWTRPRPTTRRSAVRLGRCPRRSSSCCPGCAMPPSPASSCAPWRKRRRCTRRRICSATCAAPGSSRFAGSSTRASRRWRSATRC